ncbi:hypothetical protein ACIO3O_42005 [Streptomyces sp. NPDC087440]|uniref:hypothetical protein n=1 Tax=Streptomyces sp. NPDC087440 TaxID=3365790 RepID=UPI003816AA46
MDSTDAGGTNYPDRLHLLDHGGDVGTGHTVLRMQVVPRGEPVFRHLHRRLSAYT